MRIIGALHVTVEYISDISDKLGTDFEIISSISVRSRRIMADTRSRTQKLSILPVFCRLSVKRRNFKNTVIMREEIGENIDFGSILMEPLAETNYLTRN